ncbi:MAG: DNA repair protein RecO [Bacteroidia bacterium]|nr:MAG: DNA repair protein RecO [Bacteroidia bacterium]
MTNVHGMIRNTEGIVLHTLKYGESSLIARIYTRDMGMQSYLVRGVRKSKSRNRQMLFQPLTLVNLVAYHKDNKDGLQNIKDISLRHAYRLIPFDIHRTSLAIFLAEVLSHALKSQEYNYALFDFLNTSLLDLDHQQEKLSFFHLLFLLRLSRFLGFHPRNNRNAVNLFFNLQEGVYQPVFENEQTCLDASLSESFYLLVEADTADLPHIQKDHRKMLLKKLIDYYRLHLSGMPEIKSLAVLETVFAG